MNHMHMGRITTALSPFRRFSPAAIPRLTSTYRTRGLNRSQMEHLEALPSVSRLSEHVVRVLGQNPGKFTLQGTNTYVIGKQNPYTLIDTGEGRTEYIPVLESALQEAATSRNPDEPDISDIIISHWHPDHVNGLPSVLSLLRKLWEARNTPTPFKPPRLHKFPLDPHAKQEGHNAHNTLPSIINSLPPNSYTPSPKGHVFHDLRASQTISPSGLHVLHTPGHTQDSICLYVPQDRALYTADSVLGQGTAVFEDLAAYLASLKSMLAFTGGEYNILYPGHGPVVQNGKELISGYITHRLDREAQILKFIGTPPLKGEDAFEDEPSHWTTWSIVTTMYAAYPESLWLPAAHSVDLHLKKLEDEGIVRRVGGEGKDTAWEIVDILSSPPVDS